MEARWSLAWCGLKTRTAVTCTCRTPLQHAAPCCNRLRGNLPGAAGTWTRTAVACTASSCSLLTRLRRRTGFSRANPRHPCHHTRLPHTPPTHPSHTRSGWIKHARTRVRTTGPLETSTDPWAVRVRACVRACVCVRVCAGVSANEPFNGRYLADSRDR